MNETKCEFFQLEMLHSRQMEEGVQAEQLTLPGKKIHLNPYHLRWFSQDWSFKA